MSNINKGRVTISAVVVFENGRMLNDKSLYTHMFDGHVYVPVQGAQDALGAFRYYNPGEPLETPAAYFTTAQIAAMPTVLPATVENNNILSDGLRTTDYKLIGDVKQLIPYGHVAVDADDDSGVDPRIPPFIFASGAVDRVHATAENITFSMLVEQYVGPLRDKASITVNCILDISVARWGFLKDKKKRKTFIRKGGYLSVEGLLSGLDIVKSGQERGVALEVRVEDVTLLGRAPVPSTDVIEIDDSPLRGKGKKPILSSTPLKFSYSAVAPSQSLGKRRRDNDDFEPNTSAKRGRVLVPSSSQSSEESSSQAE